TASGCKTYTLTPVIEPNGSITYDYSGPPSTTTRPTSTSIYSNPSNSNSQYHSRSNSHSDMTNSSTSTFSSSTTSSLSMSPDELSRKDDRLDPETANSRSWRDSEPRDSDSDECLDTSILTHPSLMEPTRVKRVNIQNVGIIYNPFSGSKIGEKIMNQARKYFEIHGLNVQVFPTEHKGHAEEICRTIDINAFDAMCLVGGDGTIHEAINGIMKRDIESREKFVVACIPAGTGNSFVLELQGTFSIKHICARILNGLTVPLDIAKITCVKKDSIAQWCGQRKMEYQEIVKSLQNVQFEHLNSQEGSECFHSKKTRLHDLADVPNGILMDFASQDEMMEHEVFYSFNSLHWGLGSKVNVTAEKMRWMGKAVRYTTAAVLELFKGEKILARIEYEDVDGNIIALEDFYCLAIINNIKGAAKGMKIAPKAKLNDGLFDLILIKSTKALDLMTVFAKFYDGTHTELDYVVYLQVKRFSITPFKKDKEMKRRLQKEKRRIRAAKRVGLETNRSELDLLKTQCNTILAELEDQIEEEIIDIDGELKGSTPFLCEVVPRAIRFVI
ncbi:hypothetical protein SAMD00019534_101420, partial [Acytostelium subglobosum LB1]|uniref:hypothetical protein n=1 Tax=Acytostelium subglobosum LB1 TaxID=1410327 RepID=UPI00064503B4